MSSSRDAKLLFVLSNDYGELSNARYFLQGQPFASHATLLLPPRLYDTNRGTLPGDVRRFESVEEVCRAVDEVRPDIVFLFSGYLYSINALFTVDEVERLIRFISGRVGRIVTSDPFIGALAGSSTAAPLHRIHPPFGALFELLKDAMHFYPVACHRLPARLEWFSVFNPGFLPTPSDRREDKPYSLFVLSSEDHETQVAKYGSEFVHQVAGMLAGTAREGRNAVFVGPRECAVAVREITDGVDGVVLRDFCSHHEFTSLVLDADAVFYWNLFSNSVILRLGNGLAAYFFDIGHLDRTPGLARLAVENYYLGWQPTCLDPQQPILRPVLTMVDALSRPHFERIRRHFRASPSPADAVAHILGGVVRRA